MGDVAMTIPILRVVAQTYPETKFTVLSKKFLAPLFADLPNVSFFAAEVTGKHKGVFGLMKLASEVKALGIDGVADLHNVIRSKVVSRRLRMSGISVATLDKGRAEKKKLTQAKGLGLVKLQTTHERYARVFEILGLPIDLTNHQFPTRKPLSPRLLTIIGKEPKKCIGIAPFAAYESKQYPLELMKQVITKLDEGQEYKILLFGGGKEEIIQLKALEHEFEMVTNVAGTLTFEEELDLISNLDVMLAMDSGNGHLAAMYKLPVITMWGVTHPYAGFVPFGQPDTNQLMADRNQYPLIPTSIYGNKYPKGYEKAMETIAPEIVLNKLKSLL
ncbi:MAG: glycosyltransferase family 9 protein [Bacteroidetes bacterium]|nr:glycosyltransferase family 9 protein [Bacteroidota bacterium]